MTSKNTSTSTLRDAQPDDGLIATQFLRDLGLTMPDSRDAIDAHWKRLWVDNPAMHKTEKKPSLGWVLENNDQMVGFFCNLPLLYYYGDRPVIVAAASQWGLDKRHRQKIHRLAGAYFNQTNADVLMATTANRSAGRIFLRYGANNIPQPDYDQTLYWIIDGGGFAAAAMKRKNIDPTMSSILSKTVGPFAGLVLSLGRRRPEGNALEIDVIGIEDVDDAFDDLWKRKQSEAERFLACRTSACLRWHFTDLHGERETRFLIHRQGNLRGYAIIMREDVAEIGLKRLRIADVFVEKNDESVVKGLLSAAYEYGREHGCHILEWVGMPVELRHIALGQRPFFRSLPTWPLYYKAINAEFESPLSNQSAWHVTPYDGDTTLV